MYWDAAKTYIRGYIISFVAAHKKHINKAYKEHSKNLRRAQTRQNQNPSPEHRQQWEVAKHTFDMWAEQRERSRAAYKDLQFHRYGNKTGSLLARLAKGAHKPNPILTLSITWGPLTTPEGDSLDIPGLLPEVI